MVNSPVLTIGVAGSIPVRSIRAYKKVSFDADFFRWCNVVTLSRQFAHLLDQAGFGAGGGVLFHDAFLRGFIEGFDCGENGFLPFRVLGGRLLF